MPRSNASQKCMPRPSHHLFDARNLHPISMPPLTPCFQRYNCLLCLIPPPLLMEMRKLLLVHDAAGLQFASPSRTSVIESDKRPVCSLRDQTSPALSICCKLFTHPRPGRSNANLESPQPHQRPRYRATERGGATRSRSHPPHPHQVPPLPL